MIDFKDTNIKDLFEAGLGCLAWPLLLCGFAVFIAALPLCFVVGLCELTAYAVIGLLLKLVGINIFTGKCANVAFIVLCILLIIIIAYIFFLDPNLFFSLLLFGHDVFPRIKP